MDDFSALVGDIYDSALDLALWPATLEKSASFVGGVAAALYSKHAIGQTADYRFNWGLNAGFMQDYIDLYSKFDPMTPTQFFFDIGEIYSVLDCMPYDEFLHSRFYRECAGPNGWVDQIATTLDKSATSVAIFGVLRNERQGIIDDAARNHMRLIVPHIRRAVLIGKVIDLHAGQAADLAKTLSGLASGVFLVGSDSRIQFANRAGEAMLADATPVRSERGQFRAVDPQSDRALRAVFSAARDGDLAVGTSGIAVPLSLPHEQNWMAHVLPLTSGARRNANVSPSAVAAVFVRKTSLEAASSLQTVAELYNLTRSEVRVLGAVTRLTGVPAVADALGISEATVKTHLQHLFAKTGKRRQTELVKLVAGHAAPLAP